MSELNSGKEQKRILVYGMTNNRGGIESYLMNYFRRLVREDIVFDFVTDYKDIAYKDEIEELGGKVYYIPSRREGIIKHMRALRNILGEHCEYKEVYFNILSASEVFTVLSVVGVKGVKRIVHSHNNSVKTIRRHKALRPVLNMISDIKLACSDEAAQFMFGQKSYDRHEVEIILNAIDVEKYCYDEIKRNEIRKQLKVEDAFVVGHVGRMCYQKNSVFLLEIFSHVCKKDKNAVLLYVGDGEDREKVESAISEYNIEKNVILLGMRSDVNELLQAMDVFLLPSRFEGFGMVLLEAQAAGLHSITSEDVVPKSVDVTNSVQFVSLDKCADYWASEVLKQRDRVRNNKLDLIKQSGFDIHNEAKRLKKIICK